MSDEYGNDGLRDSLVDPTAAENAPGVSSDYATRNYPPSGDTTSSGGFRGGEPEQQPNLIDQSPSGGPIGTQQQDARQGRDRAPSVRPGELNPYEGDSLETRRQAEDRLASGYRDSRNREFEGSGAGAEGDPSA